MKKKVLILLVLIVAAAGVGWATITLNNSQVQTFTVGGSTVETDAVASATDARLNFPAQQILITVKFGSTTSGSFAQGQKARDLTVVVDAAAGKVSVSDGRPVLALTSTQQAAVKSVMTNLQNQIESFLAAQNVIPGTAVAN